LEQRGALRRDGVGVTLQLGPGHGAAPATHPNDDAAGPGFHGEDMTSGEQHSPAVIRAVRIEHDLILGLDRPGDEWQDCP
jgi:hypothetical protein